VEWSQAFSSPSVSAATTPSLFSANTNDPIMTASQKVVTPVKTGVQTNSNCLKLLDSDACPGLDPRFAGMTKRGIFRLFTRASIIEEELDRLRTTQPLHFEVGGHPVKLRHTPGLTPDQ